MSESGSFTVKNVQPGDSGVYPCAVCSHSDADACHAAPKLHIDDYLTAVRTCAPEGFHYFHYITLLMTKWDGHFLFFISFLGGWNITRGYIGKQESTQRAQTFTKAKNKTIPIPTVKMLEAFCHICDLAQLFKFPEISLKSVQYLAKKK